VSEKNTKYSAIEILQRLRQNEYRHIPVVILAERALNDYILDCYNHGANTVITKPSSLALTKEKIRTFFSYWENVAELPAQKIEIIK
jgi:CheY-like chemotaxis protein